MIFVHELIAYNFGHFRAAVRFHIKLYVKLGPARVGTNSLVGSRTEVFCGITANLVEKMNEQLPDESSMRDNQDSSVA